MHNLHKKLLSSNSLYRDWHDAPLHKAAHWGVFLLVAFMTTMGLTNFIGVTSLNAETTGVTFSVNSSGLQSLKYNGMNFVPVNGFYDHIVNAAYFKYPNGTTTAYGWAANALGDTGFRDAIRTSGSPADDCNSTSVSVPTCFKHVYRAGLRDSFTVKMVWSTPDSRTAKVDVYVTNNDATSTIDKIGLEYWLGGNAVAPAPSFFNTPDLAAHSSLFWQVGAINPASSAVAFINGTWGTVAMFTDDYSNNSQIGDVWTNTTWDPIKGYDVGTTSPVSYLFNLVNYSTPGGDSSNVKVDPILPGQTWHYPLYIRFGTPTDTAATLAPDAYASYRSSLPYLLNWPDRRPIVRWFIGNGVPSPSNPRSWFNGDTSLDLVPLTAAKQSAFSTRMLTWVDQIIATMNSLNPKPQGIELWDLEGDEFYQYFTYVGNPNKLHDLAPEMDTVDSTGTTLADKIFSKFKTAGYKIGITLRPGDFQTGTVLPSTCFSDDAKNQDLDDIFIKTDGTYPYRGYTCTATNTWTNKSARWPYHQHSPQDDATILANLESKVRYAKDRWGMDMFYVDSTVYSYNGGGGSFNFQIFRQLQKDFPNTLFMPENESMGMYGATAPYNQTNPAVGGGVLGVWPDAKYTYPQAFTVLANYDGIDFTNPTIYNSFVQSVKAGNIFMIDVANDGGNPAYATILKIYREAMQTGTSSQPVATNQSFTTTSNTPVSVVLSATDANNAALTYVVVTQPIHGTLSGSSNTYTYTPSKDFAGTDTFSWKANNGTLDSNIAVVSLTVSAAVDTTLPTVSIVNPTSNSTVSGTVSIRLTTSDNIGVTKIELYKDGILLDRSTSNLSAYSYGWNTAVESNTSHSLMAKAYDAAGNVGSSAATVVTVSNPVPDTLAPSVPVNVSVNAPDSTKVNIVWSGSTDNVGVTGYNITKNGTILTSVSATNYVDTAVIPGTSYSYSVAAYDAAGNTSANSSVAIVTVPPSNNPPPTPTLSITNVTTPQKNATSFTVSWTSSIASTGSVFYGIANNKLTQLVADTATGTVHSAVITGLTKSTRYYYQVVATDPLTGTIVKSAIMNVRTMPK